MKTSELTGAALDWAVAKCEGFDTRNDVCVWYIPFEADSDDVMHFVCMADDENHALEQCQDAYPNCAVTSIEHIDEYTPSTYWAQGGPIIERENIGLVCQQIDSTQRCAYRHTENGEVFYYYSPTPLVAAMRCYVASKLGDTVEIPEEMT